MGANGKTRIMLPSFTGDTVYLVLAESERPRELHLFLADDPRTAAGRLERERPTAGIVQYIPITQLLAGDLVSSILSSNGGADSGDEYLETAKSMRFEEGMR